MSLYSTRRISSLLFLLSLGFTLSSNTHGEEGKAPLKMLVLSGGNLASRPYPEFQYFSRKVGARMVFWHSLPREWDVYHRMDAIQPSDWRKFQKPLNVVAEARLKELLSEDWDLICWTGSNLATWAREALLAKLKAGQAMIRFGLPERDGVKDELSKLFDSCKVIDPRHLGATTPTGLGQTMLALKSAAPPLRLLVFRGSSPCSASESLPYDAVELRNIFWNEVVSGFCRRELPPPLLVQCPEKLTWGQAGKFTVSDLAGNPVRKANYKYRTARAELQNSSRLDTEGVGGIHTPLCSVGDWIRLEVNKEGYRSAIRWVEIEPAAALSLSKDRWGGDFEEPIRLTVAAGNIPDAFHKSLSIVIVSADRKGNEIWEDRRSVRGKKVEETFDFTVPDLGVDTYSFYVTAWLLSGKNAIGRASTTVYHYRKWDMRRQWQWSIWDNIYAQPSYRARKGMDLFADAGFNSIGFGYSTARSVWWAERYGWRQYAEMQGGYKLWNAPVIDTADDEVLRRGVRGQMDHMFKYFGEGWRSAALTLASLGEEPGFSKGWGRTYYWTAPTAPPVAQKVFRQYLKERYTSVEALSESWQTPLKSWEDAVLEKKFSLRGPNFDPTIPPDEAPPAARDFARYQDSRDFFTWFFKKVASLATERVHELNPGASTFYSLGGPDIPTEIGEAACHHVYYPKEYQAAAAARERSRRNGMPVFSLIWNHFNQTAIQTAGHWSQVANQVTHTNLWLGVPLVFNDDLTHTRASIASKRFLTRFTPIAPLLAQATVAKNGAALLDGPFLGRNMREMQSAYAALAEAGFPPTFVTEETLSQARMVQASGADRVSATMAAALRAYVEKGGILITTSGFAARTERGRLLPSAPGQGLDEWLGIRYGKGLVSEHRGIGKVKNGGPFTTSADAGALSNIVMPDGARAVELHDVTADAEIIGRYPDETPAILCRKIGKGAVYHLNFLYTEWGWSRLFTPEREGLRKIISGIAQRENLKPRFRTECLSRGYPTGSSMPFWGSQLFVGQDGKTHYLVVFNDHRSAAITGRIHWHSKGWKVDDLLTGENLNWMGTNAASQYLDLTLLRGDGKILRLVPSGEKAESLPPPPKKPKRKRRPPARFVGLPPEKFVPVIPRGWPSEIWPGNHLTDEEFLGTLARLREVYRTGESRAELSYTLFDSTAQNRHALSRVLSEQHWPAHVPTLAKSLDAGGRILLTGEDTGFDPATGIRATMYGPKVLDSIAKLGKEKGVQFHTSRDGQVIVLATEKGRLVIDRTSIDSAGFYDREFKAWHAAWWPHIAPLLGDVLPADLKPIAAPSKEELHEWLKGCRHFADELSVTHFQSLKEQATFNNYLLPTDGHQAALLAIPQGCEVTSAELTVKVESNPGFGNGGFENGLNARGVPQGMRGIYEGRGELDKDVKHSGQYSLRLHPRTGGSKAAVLLAPLSLGRRDVNLIGKKFVLRFWIKAHKMWNLDVTIRAMEWGKPITWDNGIRIKVGRVRGSFDWKEVTLSCDLPDTRANYMNLEFRATGPEDATIWIDDFRGSEMPKDVSLIIGDETGPGLPVSPTEEGEPIVLSDGLAQRINAFLPRAPIDNNGMRIVPIQTVMEGAGRVTLSKPKLTIRPARAKSLRP